MPSPEIHDRWLERCSRRTRAAAAVGFLVLGIATMVACGGSNQVSTNTADETTSTNAPVDDTADSGSVPQGTFKPKGTFPKGTFPPKSTVTVTVPVTPAPTKAPPTTKATPPTSSLDVVKFCKILAATDLSTIDDSNWAEGFNRLYDAVSQAGPIAPPSIRQAVADLKATLDAIRPAVAAGDIASNAQLTAWFVTQTPETQNRVKAAGKQIQLYAMGNCKG